MKNNIYISYIFWGLLTTAINLMSFYLLANQIGLHYIISNCISWILSVTFAFITNKNFVFKGTATRSVFKEYILFFMSRIFTGMLDITLMLILVSALSQNSILAKIVVNIVVIITNFVISKNYVFK